MYKSQYLQPSDFIDFEHPAVASKAKELAAGCETEEELAERCFLFVRDGIKHSWDFKLNPVTCRASDVSLVIAMRKVICWPHYYARMGFRLVCVINDCRWTANLRLSVCMDLMPSFSSGTVGTESMRGVTSRELTPLFCRQLKNWHFRL
jgi:hypothetical protein